MRVAVLGITGGVGHAAAEAFLGAGASVRALVRDPARVMARDGLTVVAGDAGDPAALAAAIGDAEVVFHGLNLPYPEWDPGMIRLTDAVLAASRGRTLLFPGNVYGLAPGRGLTEAAPKLPRGRKGALRNALEARIAAACVDGTQAIVVRAGDFFGGIGASSWMHHLTSGARSGGPIQLAGPLDVEHCWAYLPDLAATFVALAERRAALPAYVELHFAGHTLTGEAWVAAVRRALGDDARGTRRFPWGWMQLARPFVPMVRELFEMRYLWDEALTLDDGRLRAALGGPPPCTPLDVAMRAALAPASGILRA